MPATWVPFYSSDLTSILLNYKTFLLPTISFEYLSYKYMIVLFSIFAISFIPYSKILGSIFNITYSSEEPYGVHKYKYMFTWWEKIISCTGGALLALVFSYSIGTNSDFIYQRF